MGQGGLGRLIRPGSRPLSRETQAAGDMDDSDSLAVAPGKNWRLLKMHVWPSAIRLNESCGRRLEQGLRAGGAAMTSLLSLLC